MDSCICDWSSCYSCSFYSILQAISLANMHKIRPEASDLLYLCVLVVNRNHLWWLSYFCIVILCLAELLMIICFYALHCIFCCVYFMKVILFIEKFLDVLGVRDFSYPDSFISWHISLSRSPYLLNHPLSPS